MRRRQELGELPADLDLEYTFLAIVAAPVLLPHIAYSLTGIGPTSPDFVSRYAQQLARIISHLAEPDPPTGDPPAAHDNPHLAPDAPSVHSGERAGAEHRPLRAT